ncbi:hypothetical protein BHM03_00007150 [Ensete ventricosum]|nr:hypothetical protein BHM03_00007150 [Ensete ventricosum]
MIAELSAKKKRMIPGDIKWARLDADQSMKLDDARCTRHPFSEAKKRRLDPKKKPPRLLFDCSRIHIRPRLWIGSSSAIPEEEKGDRRINNRDAEDDDWVGEGGGGGGDGDGDGVLCIVQDA